MKTSSVFVILPLLIILGLSACSPSRVVVKDAEDEIIPTSSPITATPAPSATSTRTPAATATSQPSPTPIPATLPLEIVEWAEYPYANLADPQNTDTRLEILARNPNEFPVRVSRDNVELRLVNTAGEIVYTNPNPTFYLWEGSWIRGGETIPISACVCFDTAGIEKQAWKDIELVVPLEAAHEIAYTTDVDVHIGEFFSLEEAHLGGDSLGTEIELVNSGDQVLKSFEVRITARDANNKYVGVAMNGSFADRDNAGGYVRIVPGASGGGIVVSEIDYVDTPLVYEVSAIGIPADE